MHKYISGVAIGILVFGLTVLSFANSDINPIENSCHNIIQETRINPVEAKYKYNGKSIEVTGTISDVRDEFLQIAIPRQNCVEVEEQIRVELENYNEFEIDEDQLFTFKGTINIRVQGVRPFVYITNGEYISDGTILPVQLSSFYSKRSDAGAVIITWKTASELDNAGFNLLRSTSRSGEFTRINAQLIPGAGTTGEKNTYTWTDTGAHPNVVYYYQIEDVSLDGAHRTLRTTRLRGHVGPHGKLTTTWGDLKSRE